MTLDVHSHDVNTVRHCLVADGPAFGADMQGKCKTLPGADFPEKSLKPNQCILLTAARLLRWAGTSTARDVWLDSLVIYHLGTEPVAELIWFAPSGDLPVVPGLWLTNMEFHGGDNAFGPSATRAIMLAHRMPPDHTLAMTP